MSFPLIPTNLDLSTADYVLEESERGVRGRITVVSKRGYTRTIGMVWEFEDEEDLRFICESMVEGIRRAYDRSIEQEVERYRGMPKGGSWPS